MVYYLPSGTKNLTALFAGIDFNEIEEYYVEALDESMDVIASSNNYSLSNCEGQKARLHFLNACGCFDALSFENIQTIHESTSDQFRKGLPNTLTKPDSSEERINVRGQDTKLARSVDITDDKVGWVKELIGTPKAFEEWTGIQGQADSFIPVRVVDQKLNTKKVEKEFNYNFTIEYKHSNKTITQRL